jgi:Trm5-related predicted tRNA methylase
MTAQGTEARVCQDIAKRQRLGLEKYGVSIEQNPLNLKEWLQHQYEELLDAAIYCKRAIEELEKTEPVRENLKQTANSAKIQP